MDTYSTAVEKVQFWTSVKKLTEAIFWTTVERHMLSLRYKRRYDTQRFK